MIDEILDQNKQIYKSNDSNNVSFEDADIDAEIGMVDDNIESCVDDPNILAKKCRNKEILQERLRLLSRK